MGSHGDVHPFIALGQKLQQRGHSVSVITSGHYRQLVEKNGFRFLSVNPDDRPRRLDPRIWDSKECYTVMASEFESQWRRQYELIKEHYDSDRTVVVAAGTAFGARIAQEKFGIRLASVQLFPVCFRSVNATPIYHPQLALINWFPKISKRLTFRIIDEVVDRRLAPKLNKLREELGLPRVRRILHEWWNSPQLVIGMFPSWFCPPQADWPKQSILADFPRFNEGEKDSLSPEVAEFLKPRRKPIVFTQGTSEDGAVKFFRAARSACIELGCRGLFVARYKRNIPPVLPKSIKHFEYIPFESVLPQASAIVHHGGIGTLASAMASGLPQLVLPKAFDQFDNACRVKQLGIGDSMRYHGCTGKQIAKRLHYLLNAREVSENCRAVQKRFESPPALDDACSAIESLVKVAAS